MSGMTGVWCVFSSCDEDGNEYFSVRPQFLRDVFATKEAAIACLEDEKDEYERIRFEDKGTEVLVFVRWKYDDEDSEDTLLCRIEAWGVTGA